MPSRLLATLVLVVGLGIAGQAHAGGKVDWSEYVDPHASDPPKAAPPAQATKTAAATEKKSSHAKATKPAKAKSKAPARAGRRRH